MMGGGFGGSVIAMTDPSVSISAFQPLSDQYARIHDRQMECLQVWPSEGLAVHIL